MLEIVVCRRSVFSFATRECLQAARFFYLCVIWILAGVQFICDTLCFIHCLHACLLWLWFLEMRLNITCRLCMWKISCLTFALTSAAFFFVKLDWCVILLCDFSLSSDVPKHLPLSISLILNESHTQTRCCFVLSVFLSFCISKATLFAFSGRCLAVKAPYQLLSMFQSLSLSPR